MKKIFFSLMAAACVLTANAKEDVTSTYLTNADLTSLDGWNIYKADDAIGGSSKGYTDWKTDGATPVIEFYHSWSSNAGAAIGNTKKFDFAQTITLPAGYYRLKVNSFYREGNGGSTSQEKTFIYATTQTDGTYDYKKYVGTWSSLSGYTGGSELYQAADAFSKGAFANEFDFDVEEDDTEITVGFHGYIDTYCSWCILGPVSLYKYEISDFTADFDEKAEQAKALYEKPMDATVLATLKAKAEPDQSAWSTKEDISNASSELTTAINNANASINAYAAAKAIVDAAEARATAAGVSVETAKASFTSAYNAGTLNGNTEANAVATAYSDALTAKLADYSDVTARITNPSFESGVTGWTTVEGWANNNPYFHTNTSAQSFKDGNNFVEGWVAAPGCHGDETLTQTLANLPKGEFILTVMAKNEQESGNIAAKGLFVNFGENSYEVNSASGEQCAVAFTNEAKGNVTIGLEIKNSTGNWIAADNFKLYFKGIDTGMLDDLITEAETYYETIQAKEYAADLNEAIATAKAAEPTTADDVTAAVTALQEALNAAKLAARQETYADLADGKYVIAHEGQFLGAGNSWGTQASLVAHPEYVELAKLANGKYTIKSQVSNGGDSQYFNGSYMDGGATGIEIIGTEGGYLLSNGTQYFGGETTVAAQEAEFVWTITSLTDMDAAMAYATEGAPYDVTYKVMDPGFGRNNVNNGAWTKVNASANGDVTNKVMESWHKDGFSLTQVISNLPAGTYELKANAVQTEEGYAPVIFANGVQVDFPMKSEEETATTAAGYATAFVNGNYEISVKVNVKDGSLKIGFEAPDNTNNWCVMDNVQLYYLGTEADAENSECKTMAISQAGYATFCAPTEVAIPETVNAYTVGALGGKNGNVLTLTQVEGTIPANTPVVISGGVTSLDVFTSHGDGSCSNGLLTGVYAATEISEGYVLQNQEETGVGFYKVENDITVPANRCYLNAPASEAKALYFEGAEATAINAVEALTSGKAQIYDINGRQLQKLQKGINIVNGVKVLVK